MFWEFVIFYKRCKGNVNGELDKLPDDLITFRNIFCKRLTFFIKKSDIAHRDTLFLGIIFYVTVLLKLLCLPNAFF